MPTDTPYHAPTHLPCPKCGKLMRLVTIEPSESEQGADESRTIVVLAIMKKSTSAKPTIRERSYKRNDFYAACVATWG
jgi:hypothetical protein